MMFNQVPKWIQDLGSVFVILALVIYLVEKILAFALKMKGGSKPTNGSSKVPCYAVAVMQDHIELTAAGVAAATRNEKCLHDLSQTMQSLDKNMAVQAASSLRMEGFLSQIALKGKM